MPSDIVVLCRRENISATLSSPRVSSVPHYWSLWLSISVIVLMVATIEFVSSEVCTVLVSSKQHPGNKLVMFLVGKNIETKKVIMQVLPQIQHRSPDYSKTLGGKLAAVILGAATPLTAPFSDSIRVWKSEFSREVFIGKPLKDQVMPSSQTMWMELLIQSFNKNI